MSEALSSQEESLLYELLERVKTSNRYPEEFFDEDFTSYFYAGCRAAKFELRRDFGGFNEFGVGIGGFYEPRFKARTFLPMDFGLKSFLIGIGRGEFTLIPDHWHKSAIRVVVGFMDSRTPTLMAVKRRQGDRKYGVEPLRWIYHDSGYWFARLHEPYIIKVEEGFCLKGIPLSDLERRSEATVENIADALSGEPWPQDEPEPVGLIYTMNEWEDMDEIAKRVRII